MMSKIWIEGNLENCLRFTVNLKISVCHDKLSTGHGSYLQHRIPRFLFSIEDLKTQLVILQRQIQKKTGKVSIRLI